MSDSISIKVEFSGGLELLFSNQRSHKITLPIAVPSDNNTVLPVPPTTESTKPTDITYLIHYLRDHLLQERAELFEENGTVYVYSAVALLEVTDELIHTLLRQTSRNLGPR